MTPTRAQLPPTVGETTEDELIAAFLPLLPRGASTIVASGDDAALVAAPQGGLLVATDVLVEDQHFRLEWARARDVGWRAAMQNLADIAGMGGWPTSIVVGLVIPAHTAVSWVLDLCRGLAEACSGLGVGIVGGDLTRGDKIVVAVTVHGRLLAESPVLRSTARAGEVLAHAGVLGSAAAGYELLRARTSEDHRLDEPWAGDLIDLHLRPRPPLQAASEAVEAGATAMMDVSDGLLRDAGRLSQASSVTFVLDPVKTSAAGDLEVLRPAAQWLNADAATWVLAGGEDHGLLATFPAGTELPPAFRRLGLVVEPDDEGPRVLPATEDSASVSGEGGWDHFAR